MRGLVRILAGCLLLAGAAEAEAGTSNPRLFVLTDIGNEPDDQMSLVRLLLYSNEIDIEGIGAVTSTWQKDKVRPDIAKEVIAAYGQVRANLALHEGGWPDERLLAELVSSGVPAYGLKGIETADFSPAARDLLAAADRKDGRPLWISLWGGANTLAQALAHARATRSPEDLAALISRLRVYSISDQDDAGPWIRSQFRDLFYIVTPSNPDGADYARATWTGISGDRFYRNGQGADFRTVTNEWLDENIRSKGTLGAHYPRYMFIMEGDTPSFLGLIPNGLQSKDTPNWGSWGGRYLLRQPYGEARPIWTQGGDSFARVTSADSIGGTTSDQATIWRWREAFQNDFAARMSWTVEPFAKANHPPVVKVGESEGSEPLVIEARVGQQVSLDASGSRDPDGQRLSFKWFWYPEAGFSGGMFGMAPVRITGSNSAKATLTPTATCSPNWLGMGKCPEAGEAHVILAVTDTGKPALTRYRRIIIKVGHPSP